MPPPDSGAPPAPWQRGYLHVGGVCGVAFSADGRWLLVISHNGTGLFDCESLERVSRDYSDYGAYDRQTGTVDGIGALEGMRVPIHGMRGAIETSAQLPTRTADGWELQWKEEPEYLGRPDTPVYLRAPHQVAGPGYLLGEFEPIYAIGFSPTGRTLVIAESYTITVFSRPQAGT